MDKVNTFDAKIIFNNNKDMLNRCEDEAKTSTENQTIIPKKLRRSVLITSFKECTLTHKLA